MNRLLDWLDHRTGWIGAVRETLETAVPGGARWARVFGTTLLGLIALQVVTGVLLAFTYAPTADGAWASVNYLETQVFLGRFVRALHHWGASAVVILLACHVAQVMLWGAYRAPREVNWVLGVFLLGLVLAQGFTGYLLPWDQTGYWATRVGLGIAGGAPGLGVHLARWLQGGPTLGTLTLARFFTLHTMVVPALIGALLLLHVRLHRRTGPASPSDGAGVPEPFWPGQGLRDLIAFFVVVIGLSLIALRWPAPLEEPANPGTPFDARPEWYFLFFFQLLKLFPGPLEMIGSVILPGLAAGLVLALPWIDPSHRRLRLAGLTGALAVAGLTAWAAVTDALEAPARTKALFEATCAKCHGRDGKGASMGAPNFTDPTVQAKLTDADLERAIRKGAEDEKTGARMPAWEGKLSRTQIRNLIDYIRHFY